MTIKHTNKNISAENKNIITGVTLNENTGILTITQKNLYNDENETTTTTDLNNIKLRIIKLANQTELITLENDNTKEDYKKTHLFLVPLSENNTEGLYAEYIYIDAGNDTWQFERIGSTALDLSNYVQKSNTSGVIKNNGDILIIDNTSGGTGSSTSLITSGAVNAGLSGKANSLHSQTASTITDMETVNIVVTYTDNTTETLTLFKQKNNS